MDLKITPSGQTIVKPTALGPGANTDTKALVINKVDNSRGSQKEFGSLWCPSSLKRVVPIAVKGVRFEVKLVHLSVTNLQACFVSPLV